mmetsp:Transcript_5065/g.12149  ORF Transcript_5065/g.12149 Transcript_5065/m.12149 type:complete len:857 (-) Transcript_5065:79-2649(-)
MSDIAHDPQVEPSTPLGSERESASVKLESSTALGSERESTSHAAFEEKQEGSGEAYGGKAENPRSTSESMVLVLLQQLKDVYLKEVQDMHQERAAFGLLLQQSQQHTQQANAAGGEGLQVAATSNRRSSNGKTAACLSITRDSDARFDSEAKSCDGSEARRLSEDSVTVVGSSSPRLSVGRRVSCLRTENSPRARNGLRNSCTVTSVESIFPYPHVPAPADDAAEDLTMQADRNRRAAVIGSLMKGGNFLLRSCLYMWRGHARAMRKPLVFTLREQLDMQGVDSRSTAEYFLDPVVANAVRSSRVERNVLHDIDRLTSQMQYDGWLIHPSSRTRIGWDIMGGLWLVYDVAVIPMTVFDIGQNTFTTFMEWMTLFYWTLDMAMSCVTGVVKDGATCMDFSTILKTYLKSWFPLDVLVVGPDWIFTIIGLANGSSEGSDTADSGRLLRVIRTARVARLLRLAKLQHIFRMLRDRIDSEMAFISVNIVKLVALLFVLNHYTASVWYWIGSESRRAGAANWLDEELRREREISIGYWYTTSLHWSMCMFTPGSMGVEPHNMAERTYAITVLLFGMVIFSSFVSSVTAAVAQLKTIRSDNSQELWLLRRFLKQRSVEKELAFRVLRYAEYAYRADKDLLPESKVWALTLLSTQLRSEIKYEVSFPCLREHPFFKRLGSLWAVSLKEKLVSNVLSQKSLADGDLLYEDAVHSTHMHFVAFGSLAYIAGSQIQADDSDEGLCQKLFVNEWLCEPVLFTVWVNRGTAKAVSESEVVSMEAVAFCEAVQADFGTQRLTNQYAVKFLDFLNTIPRGRLTDVGSELGFRDVEADIGQTQSMVKSNGPFHWARSRSRSDGFLGRIPTF